MEKTKKKPIQWNLFLDVMFFARPEGKSPLGRSRCLLHYNIKIDIQ